MYDMYPFVTIYNTLILLIKINWEKNFSNTNKNANLFILVTYIRHGSKGFLAYDIYIF